MSRLRVLFVPAAADYGAYRSLGRVEATTRDALARHFELVELPAHPAADRAAYLAGFAALRPDAVVDMSDAVAHGADASALAVPTLLFALGNMPAGATIPWLRRGRLRTTDVLLLNCTSDLAIWERALGGSGPRGALLPLGVDTERFRPRDDAERRSARALLGLPPDAFVLLYAGRLNVQKNLHSLVLLLRALAGRGVEAHLVLAGAFDDVPHLLFEVTNEGYEEALRLLVRRGGLEERVRFPGQLGDEDLALAHAASDVFVSLSLHNNENFGYAPVEAMACGRPAVVSHFGGYKDTVVHGATGAHVETLMTDHGLRAAWRQGLEPLVAFARDPAARARAGALARERAVSEYGLEAFGRRLAGHVREAVERRREGPGAGGESFRFHPEAMKLHLRNLHRTWSKAEGRPRGPGMRVEYPTYRWFQGMYATRDLAGATLDDDDPLAFLTRCHLDRRGPRLESLDPIWPRAYELAPAEAEMLAALEPGVPLRQLLDRGEARGLARADARALLDGLLRDGVVFPERPFRAA